MEKQFKPSKKRLEKERKEGNVPKSQYLSSSVGVLAGLLLCLIYLSYSWVEHRLLIEYLWTSGFKDPGRAVSILASKYFFITLKLLLIVSGVAVLTETVQAGMHLEPGLLALKLNRIDPASGLKKLFGNIKRSWLVVLRFVITLTVLSWFLFGLLNGMEALLLAPFGQLLEIFYRLFIKLVAVSGLLLIILALLDYYVQWRRWFNGAGMTMHDLKQENKEDEGDPYIKSLRKHTHRELLQQDLIKRIRSAKVIIVERAS